MAVHPVRFAAELASRLERSVLSHRLFYPAAGDAGPSGVSGVLGRSYRRSVRVIPWLIPVLLVSLLSACGSTGPAPVVSREYSGQDSAKRRISGGYYRVRSGDTLYSIAWRAGQDFRSLAVWNGIRRPYTIYPGQRLRLGPPPKAKPKRRQRAEPRPGVTRTTRADKPKKTRTHRRNEASAAVEVKRKPAGKTQVSSARLRWQWPTKGRLLQRFSSADRTRQGIKIGGRLGQAIHAAEAGTIVYSGSGLIGYGRLIIVKHNKNYLSAYGHNRKILVKEGDQVAKGERIAEMGKSSDGRPVLHFEIRRKGTPVDPVALLPKRG